MTDISTVVELAERYCNWNRWGPDDELGTLNHVRPEDVVAASASVASGHTVPLGMPYDETGPQTGGFNRFNPIHLMIRDGADAMAGTTVRDFYGGFDGHMRGTDDLLIMPLQCGTQWDALSHVVFRNKIYNGYSADQVSSLGALKNDIAKGSDRMVGRGVLLDLPRSAGSRWLDPGYPISAEDLEACERRQSVRVRRGDFVFIRTGQLAQVRDRGRWDDYAGGDAPGLGLASVPWVAEREVAAVATDTWGMEVRPNETPDVFQPLHIIFIVHLGLWVGEIFDLERVAEVCAQQSRYEFLFCGPPLPITRAVGSPLSPLAIM